MIALYIDDTCATSQQPEALKLANFILENVEEKQEIQKIAQEIKTIQTWRND